MCHQDVLSVAVPPAIDLEQYLSINDMYVSCIPFCIYPEFCFILILRCFILEVVHNGAYS